MNSTPAEALAALGLDDQSPEQSLADDNLRAQEHLWSSLASALQDSERTLEDVASRIGVPVELVQAISQGRVDISLSDLREYAYAVDACITYRVTSRYTSNLENFRRSLAEEGHLPWRQVASEKIDHLSDAKSVLLRAAAEKSTGVEMAAAEMSRGR